MKFAISFSGGKDSILALHEMMENGHEPAALLVTYRQETGRSWFHGITPELLDTVSEAMRIPLIRCDSTYETYFEKVEWGLAQAKALGAEACVFGDIEPLGHRTWAEERCAAVGLRAVLPLWKRDHLAVVRRTLSLGYRCIIKCVRTVGLPETWLGQTLSETHIQRLLDMGLDPCGEKGEYHTIVTDGPLFHHPVHLKACGTFTDDDMTVADLTVKDGEDCGGTETAFAHHADDGR